MRKMIAVAFAAVVFVLVVAAPAMAQTRDPFRPVIDTTGGGATDGGGGSVTLPEGEVPPPLQNEVMANTGADTEPWLVAAYVLVAAGAGIVVLSKTLAPTPAPVRRRRN